MTISESFYTLLNALQPLYSRGEATAISHIYLQHLTGKDKLQRLSDKNVQLSDIQQAAFDEATYRIASGEPLQYVIGQAYFMGHDYIVNAHVLIPRPETEELVQWVIDDWTAAYPDFDAKTRRMPVILDIGTGSGCIPVSLKLRMPDAAVTSCDISEDALSVAKANADRLGVTVDLLHLDFLNDEIRKELPRYDVIVSNPPYIPFGEKETLDANVRNFEPGTALFVPDDDPLLFYRQIALFGQSHLAEGGTVYCEVHRDYAESTERLFVQYGYATVLRTDMQGAPRMIKAQLLRE